MEYQNQNKKQKNLAKTKIQLKNSQFCTKINEKMVQMLNQSCQSLNFLFNKQQPISKHCCSDSSNQMRHLNQSVIQADSVKTQLRRRTFLDNQKLNTSGKTIKKSTILRISKKRSKEMAKMSKSKTSLVRRNSSVKMGCYTRKKYYRCNTENNSESTFCQVRPINKYTIKNANTVKKRINKLYGTCSAENVNVVCYESDYKLITDKNKKITTVFSSLNVIENTVFEKNNNFYKQFKVNPEGEVKLHHQTNVDNIDYTSDDNKEIEDYSKTFSSERTDHKSKQNHNLKFACKEKENTNISSNSFKGNNNLHLLFTPANKQQQLDEFLQNYYVNKANKENDKYIKQQDKTELPNNFATRTANNGDNSNLNNTFIEKIKQQIVKLADRITPKISDNETEETNYLNTLIINDIKLQEIVKLFNSNSSKLQKESNKSTKSTNLLYSREHEINKLDRDFLINHIKTTSDRVLFTDKNTKKIDNISSNNLSRIPQEKNIVNKSEINQKFGDDYLMENLATESTESNSSMENFNNNNRQNLIQDKRCDKNDVTCNIQNILPLRKTLQYQSVTTVGSSNVSHVNSLTINVNARTNYEINTLSEFANTQQLNIKKDPKHCSECKTTPNFLLHKKDASASILNVPYAVSVKSIPKINIEKVRPNSKFSTKNTLYQNDGIYQPNARNKRKVEELGIQSSSSSKCCRKQILNEKPEVDLPYNVSLTSLPSNAVKMVIKPNSIESLESNNYPETCLTKLNYYSNLETGLQGAPKNTYEVRYFELKRNFQSEGSSQPPPSRDTKKTQTFEKKDEQQQTDAKFENKSSNCSSESSKYVLPWGQSFEVRVFEYASKPSDTDLPLAMSSKYKPAPETQRRSKYYSYPDEEDYIRNAQRKPYASERRPDDATSKMLYRRPMEAPGPGAPHIYGEASHTHGESRLPLEPWAPFSISDTSLPGLRNRPSPYQGPAPAAFPEKSSERSNNLPRNKDSRMDNRSTTGTERPNLDERGNPVMLTPELLKQIARGFEAGRVPQNADSFLKNRNMPRNYDFQPQYPRTTCCPITRNTVSTDTDDLPREYRRSPKIMIDSSVNCQGKQSLCFPCEKTAHTGVKAKTYVEPVQKDFQKPCSSQLNRIKTCTPKEPSNLKTTQYEKNNNTGQSPSKCGVLKDLCLCDYTGNYQGPCGSKCHRESVLPSQNLLLKHSTTSYNHGKAQTGNRQTPCDSKQPKESEGTNNKNLNNKPNTPSCNDGKVSNASTDSKRRKSPPGCFKSYNNNPHVMYYLGEQRNNLFKIEHNSTDKYQPTANIPTKLFSSPEEIAINRCHVDMTNSLHDPKTQPISEQITKPEKSMTYQENVVQFCIEPPSNKIKLPLHHQNLDHPKIDEIHQHKLKKIQTEKYYVLCLPNETSLSNEKTNVACFPYTELITPNDNSSEQLHDHKNCKPDKNNSQGDKISIMLQSYLNYKNKEPRTVESKQKLLTSSSFSDELLSEKCKDSTIYVFQTKPDLSADQCSINKENKSNITQHTEISSENDIPIKHKTVIKLNKESDVESLKDSTSKLEYQEMGNEVHYYQSEQNENANKLKKKKSNICKQKRDNNYSQNSSKNNLSVVVEQPSSNKKITKHLQYCSIGINTDSAYDSVSEVFANQSYSDVTNPLDYNEPLSSNLNSANESFNIPEKKQSLMQDWTQKPNMLAKQFETFIANFTTEELTDRVTARNKPIIERSEEIDENQNSNKIKVNGNDKQRLIRNIIDDCLPQNSSHITSVDNSLIKDSSKVIPVNNDISKYSIIISQLADVSSGTNNISIPSSTQCLKDITNQDIQSNLTKCAANINIRDCYCKNEQLPPYSSKSTQSPPVIYRSKISDFIKNSIPGYQFSNDLINLKSEHQIDNCNLVNYQTNNSNKNEHETFSKIAEKRISSSKQINGENNSKTRESILCKEHCLTNQKSSNIIKNTHKISKIGLQPIHTTNYDKRSEASIQYIDRSEQTHEVEVACTEEGGTKVDDNENKCGVNNKVQGEVETYNNRDYISDTLKTIMSKRSSTNAINTPISPVDSSNSDTDVCKSRLFACNSWLTLPIQFQNKKCALGGNTFWIPPDYDNSEFNVYASESRLSNYVNYKDNNDNNISRQSSRICNTTQIESVCNKDKNNISSKKSLHRDLGNQLQDNQNQSFVTPKEQHKKDSLSSRIIPVTLAMSQEECQKVSSGPIIPVVLAISQQEHQKDSSSAPDILSNIKHRNDMETASLINLEKVITTQEKSVTKKFSDGHGNKLNYSSNTQNCGEQQIVESLKFDKNEDKVYWALTRVKTHRDGSQDLEILDATPIPPGHFLVPTANNVVLVEDQPYVSDENQEVDKK